jgi:hypothetical protein
MSLFFLATYEFHLFKVLIVYPPTPDSGLFDVQVYAN